MGGLDRTGYKSKTVVHCFFFFLFFFLRFFSEWDEIILGLQRDFFSSGSHRVFSFLPHFPFLFFGLVWITDSHSLLFPARALGGGFCFSVSLFLSLFWFACVGLVGLGGVWGGWVGG